MCTFEKTNTNVQNGFAFRMWPEGVGGGARSGLGPIWAHRALMGPYGPLRASFWFKKLIILMTKYTTINKDIKVVKT